MKLIKKQVSKDIRKMLKEWHERRNVGIDVIIKRFGYTPVSSSMYKYRKMLWQGLERYEVTLDTFSLIHEDNGNIEVSIVLK